MSDIKKLEEYFNEYVCHVDVYLATDDHIKEKKTEAKVYKMLDMLREEIISIDTLKRNDSIMGIPQKYKKFFSTVKTKKLDNQESKNFEMVFMTINEMIESDVEMIETPLRLARLRSS